MNRTWLHEVAKKTAKSESLKIQLHHILGNWFEAAIPRGTGLHFNEGTVPRDIAKLAAVLFKRGAPFLTNTTTGESESLEPDSESCIFPFLKFCGIEGLVAENFSKTENVFFVVDKNVARLWPKNVRSMNSVGVTYFLEANEQQKNLGTLWDIINNVPSRTEVIVGVGGGITLDIAGLAAGLLGLFFDVVPTTILACVDATVGGKTGVNFSGFGKNQIGLFYNPRRILIAPKVFSTLGEDEVLAGLAEAVKHSWLDGTFEHQVEAFDRIISNREEIFSHQHLLLKNLQTKMFAVLKDPKENLGVRTLLNFGHTFAHLIEALGTENFVTPVPHGIAVAWGMRSVFRFRNNPSRYGYLDLLDRLLDKYDFKERFKVYEAGQGLLLRTQALLRADKKAKVTNAVRLVCPPYGVFAQSDLLYPINLDDCFVDTDLLSLARWIQTELEETCHIAN